MSRRLSLILFSVAVIGSLAGTVSANERTLEDLVAYARQPGVCFFDPPKDWQVIDPSALPRSVKIAIRCPEKNKFPPSMNLAVDKISCDLKTYLKKIRAINEAEGADFKELGSIETAAGTASLSQLDMNTNWGPVRMMHTILAHEGHAYILTVAALREEFPSYYELFFKTMKSLRLNPEEEDAEASHLALRPGLLP